ncbi:HK97-gp10 family putative phage morphogenesis protein [Mesorhizobium sp. AA22]|uniref:HK97-gp10 family putative phage morphogenesis protein n=1 Tax=Mesorhizobium sp. AA22 TaxID=1854057 RepID=UPI0007ECC756|nr:HK97-gp10 family putative phage morphogenesis protein [Mesorhizobium sp. AA22]QIA23097.1 HK97 gp10 family phage protein [Mesorhizobium sp. AA22]
MARDDLASLLKAFDVIPKAARKGISKAIDKGADELVARMQYLAPDDPKTAADDLKSSIHAVKNNELSTTVTTDNDHALYQEFGTADMDRNSFFWPAVNTLKKRVRGRVDRAINTAIKDTFK